MKPLELTNKIPIECKNKIYSLINSTEYDGYMSSVFYKELLELSRMKESDFLVSLLEIPKAFALPEISKFYVGAIAKAPSGNLYFGANQEFLGTALNFTLHAEQSSISNAFIHEEKTIDEIIVNYIPCCLCRQFMTELKYFKKIKIIMPDKTLKLEDLIPIPFGPSDLEIDDRLLATSGNNNLTPTDDILKDSITMSAFHAANNSYAPYSKSYSGVAIMTKTNKIIQGRYIENAAYNISMNPMSAALSLLNLTGFNYTDILKAVIIEPKSNLVSQINHAANLLKQTNNKIALEIKQL